MKPLPKTRTDLEAAGYIFDGLAQCKGCGAPVFWFTTPNAKRMAFNWKLTGEDELEPHRDICPQVQEFRKPRMGKTPKKGM